MKQLKKRIICLFASILFCMCLTGCMYDVNYTILNASFVAHSYSKDCKHVNTERIGPKETIWTYYDKNLNGEFYVHEFPYWFRFDGSQWDARDISTNYDYLVGKYILNSTDIDFDYCIIEDDGENLGIEIYVYDRDDLRDKISKLKKVIQDVNTKTKKSSYWFEIKFTCGGKSYTIGDDYVVKTNLTNLDVVEYRLFN